MFSSKTNGGISIIGVIFLAIIVIVVLNYFHLSLKVSVESTNAQNSSIDRGGVLQGIWATYFDKPVTYLWNEVILKYLWQPFVEGIKSGPGPSTNLTPDNSP